MRLIILFIVFCQTLAAQFVAEQDILLPIADSGDQPGVVAMGEDGLAIYRETTGSYTPDKRTWHITFFDKNLEFAWDSGFESEVNFALASAKYTSGCIYLLFQDTNIPMKSIFFVRCYLQERSITFFRITEFLPAELIDFETLENALFLIGQDQNRPLVLKFSFGDPRPLVLKGLFDAENEILHTSVNQDLKYIQIISRMKKSNSSVILVKKFDQAGENIRDILLESSKGYHLINAIAQTDAKGNTAIVGVFGKRRSKFSTGIFTGVFREGIPNQIFYYDYVNLRNYFNFIANENSRAKIRQKYLKSGSGKSYEINHVPRSVFYADGNWQFVGEVLQTAERVVNTNLYTYQPMEVTNYSHAILLSLDENGKIIWDNTFSMNELSSFADGQQAFIYSNPAGQIAFYTDGYKIHHLVHNGASDQYIVGETEIGLPDPVFNSPGLERDGNILHWYDNAFLIFGTNALYSSPRYSFYIHKFSVTDDMDN